MAFPKARVRLSSMPKHDRLLSIPWTVYDGRYQPGTLANLLCVKDRVEHVRRRKRWDKAFTTTAIKEYDKALSTLQELQTLLKSSDKELRELAEDDVEPTHERIGRATADLKTSLIPVHPFAHLPCLIEIRPGAGGDEAGLFAGDLLRM